MNELTTEQKNQLEAFFIAFNNLADKECHLADILSHNYPGFTQEELEQEVDRVYKELCKQ